MAASTFTTGSGRRRRESRALAFDREIAHPGSAPSSARSVGSANSTVDPAALALLSRSVDPLDRDHPPVADDPDPVAGPLDLVELMRGEEYRAAALAFLA